MPDLAGLDALPSKAPMLITLAVRPEEIELALATNGASLRHRLLLALVAELTIIETTEPATDLPWIRARLDIESE